MVRIQRVVELRKRAKSRLRPPLRYWIRYQRVRSSVQFRCADLPPGKKNFNIYYKIDEEEVSTALRGDEYGGDEDFSWVLLEASEAVAAPAATASNTATAAGAEE